MLISDDAWLGGARFTVSVNGIQIGGIQRATASHAAGQDQAFTLLGNFGTGPRTVSVTVLNDASGGSPSEDANLYVDSITDGDTTRVVQTPPISTGTLSFVVGAPTSTGPVTIGAGPQSLVLHISEDAWHGDAEFSVKVNGIQIGGIQTATASHAAGEDQAFTLLGNFGTGPQTVSVTFLNDAYGGSPSTDRNLYIDSITDGSSTDVTDAPLFSNSTRSFVISPVNINVRLADDTGSSNSDLITSDPALTGVAHAKAIVTIMEGATVLGTATANASGIWTYIPKTLANGANTIEVSTKGATGDVGTASLSFVVDTIAPAVSVYLANDTGISDTDGITNDSTLTGTADPNTVVTITQGNSVLGTATVNASGNWTDLPQGLANGANTVVVTDRDVAGNVGSASLAFVLDTVPPEVTVGLSPGSETPGSNQVTSNPTLVGTGDPSATVVINQGVTVLGTANANSSGNWSYTPTGLANGATTITVGEADIAGNLGTASMSFILNVPLASSFSMGINLSGLEYNRNASPGTPYVDYVPPSTTELAYYHSEGINTIRLPFLWERIQPILNGPLNPTYVSEIQTIVDYAGSLGMKVILDMHDYGGYGADKLGDGTLTDAQFADVWTKIASVFTNNPGLGGYDLMNEPNGMPNPSAWPTAAQAAVNAIRTVDTTSTIYVEGDDWASAGSWTQDNANLNIQDPYNKIIYEAHVYLDSDNSGTHYDWGSQAALGVTTETGVERVEDFEGWLLQNGFQGDIGEIGAPVNNTNWLTSLNNTLAYAQSVGLPVQYWAGGPWWGSYPMSAEPTGLGTATVTNAPQMAVLTQYT